MTQRLGEARGARSAGGLRMERKLLVEAAPRGRYEVGVVVPEKVRAVTTDEIDDRHEPAVPAEPEGVALAPLVDRVETKG
jgi:hypothetical protein